MPKEIRVSLASLEDLPTLAQRILSEYGDERIFAFFGEMGAGKTTTIKALCAALGVTDVVSSPTFAIINEYKTSNKDKIFHFDFYRLNNLREALDLGYEDYFFSGHYCLLEWPERVPELLPDHYVKILIETVDATHRNFCLCSC